MGDSKGFCVVYQSPPRPSWSRIGLAWLIPELSMNVRTGPRFP